MRTTFFALAAVALLTGERATAASLSARAAAAIDRRAHAKMRALDFEAAIPLLQKVAQAASLPTAKRASLYLDLGVAFVNVGHDDDARQAFVQALGLDPKVALAGDVSPKIRDLFEQARAQLAPPPPAPMAETAPPVEATPPRTIQATPPPAALATPPAPEAALEARPSTGSRSLVAPIILEVGAAAALGVGIGAGLASAGAAHSLLASVNQRSVVDGLVSQQQTFAIVSIVGYVVAGLAAVAGVTVYALEKPAAGADADQRVGTLPDPAAPLAFSF